MALKKKKSEIVIPPATGYTCRKISLDNAMRFILEIETDEWEIESSEGGIYEG